MASVVVCGGGVIGSATAYYLAQKGLKPVIVENCAPAASASGKAGGFLALDWCDGGPLGPLARRSFQLHSELAETLGGSTGYRRLDTHSLSVQAGGAQRAVKRSQRRGSLPAWVSTDSVTQASVIGSPATTAQVDPELLTKALLREAEARGGRLVLAALSGLERSGGRLTGVRVRSKGAAEESLLPADAVVFALGAWTSKVLRGLGLPAVPEVSGLKVHSIVLQDADHATTPDALFLTYLTPEGSVLEPEVYPRNDGTTYICGVSEEIPVPETADDVGVRPEAIATLRDVAATVSGALAGAQVLRQQACYLPCSEDGLPLIGRLPGLEGAYLATGHSCWGILNGPATGEALAELIVDGSSSIDLSAFDPARLAAA